MSATINILMNLGTACTFGGGCGSDRQTLGFQFQMPGNAFYTCNTNPPGFNWGSTLLLGQPIGTVTAYSANIYEDGSLPSRQSQGAYVVTSSCLNNFAQVYIRFTEALYDGLVLNIGIQLGYPVT